MKVTSIDFALTAVTSAIHASKPELVSIMKIWDSGAHNAFTDLIRFGDRWWCTFREGAGHASGDGKVRMIFSDDGDDWQSAALVAEKGIDSYPGLVWHDDLLWISYYSSHEGKTSIYLAKVKL